MSWTAAFLVISACCGARAESSAQQEPELYTDKRQNAWTISKKFKEDIVAELWELHAKRHEQPSASKSPGRDQNQRATTTSTATPCRIGVELGAHVGLTTGLLAKYCEQVWAFEHSLPVLASIGDLYCRSS